MAEPGTTRILVVDDDPAMAALVRQLIRAHGFGEPRIVASGTAALAEQDPADIVLLDQQLPDYSGLDLLGALRAGPGRPSVVVITGNGDETLAAAALRGGAEDYLVKDGALPQLLPQVLERVRRTRALRSALAAAEGDLIRAERLAAIGQLMVTLHHEINNPLMAATAEMALLRERAADPETRAALDNVQQALERIRQVLKQVGDLGDARTTSYLGGIGMIDLSATGSPTAASRGDAVLWMADERLALIAGSLLRHGGFTVRSVGDIEELVRESRRIGIAVVVVQQPAGPGARPLGGFRVEPGRFYRLIALAEGSGEEERKAGADLVVHLPFDPGAFTEEVLRVLES